MKSLCINSREDLLPRLTALTQKGKIPWRIIQSRNRNQRWDLQDACNILSGKRNGISIRFCQNQDGKFFLHLMNPAGIPVRLNCPQSQAEMLLAEIANTIPALKHAFEAIDQWASQTCPTSNPSWLGQLINKIFSHGR